MRAREPGLHFLGYFRNERRRAQPCSATGFAPAISSKSDAEGWLYYAGRKTDSVRRRGINISAWEVERVVNDHEAIEESALVGVPGELGDDELKLIVRVVAGKQLDPAEFLRWCEPRLPYFQIPRYLETITEFPKTPTQRIRKNQLARSVEHAIDLSAFAAPAKKRGT